MISALLPKLSNGYPWCFDVAICAFGFLLLGQVTFPAAKAFRRFCSEKKVKGIIICSLAMLLSFAATLTYKLNLPYVEERVLVAEAHYGNMLLFLLTAVLGIVFTMAAAVLLDLILPTEGKSSRAITYIGENTMAVFCLHKPIIKVFQKAFGMVHVPSLLALIVTCIGTVICCSLIAVFLNRYLPTSVGRIPPSTKKMS